MTVAVGAPDETQRRGSAADGLSQRGGIGHAARGASRFNVPFPIATVQRHTESRRDQRRHPGDTILSGAARKDHVRLKVPPLIVGRRGIGEMNIWGVRERQVLDPSATSFAKVLHVGGPRRKDYVALSDHLYEPLSVMRVIPGIVGEE